MSDTIVRRPPKVDALTRYLPLAGAGYAALVITGFLTIGEFPDGDTSPSALVSYYAEHHGQVSLGGRLLECSAVLLGLFVVALWARARTAGPWATVILVGGAVYAAASAFAGATYTLLGDVAADPTLDPVALQALHQPGADFEFGAGVALMGVGVLMASLDSRAFPAWLAWPAAVLGIAQLTPIGFFASLAFLLWSLVAGIMLAGRPVPPA